MAEQSKTTGPDLKAGIVAADVADRSMVEGHVDGRPVLLARLGDEFLAITNKCTPYSGPLGQGLLVGDTVRCPWHHACFSLRTGEALRAPALDPVDCWTVTRADGRVCVTGKAAPAAAPSPVGRSSDAILIVGTGAAGNAAAEALRGLGFAGRVTMVGDDESVPYDRPNLSKDYLAGHAEEDWIPLRSDEFYRDQHITLTRGTAVTAVDVKSKRAWLNTGDAVPYTTLLLATGAEPVRLTIPGADLPHVRTLRSLADSRVLIERAAGAKRAVVLGASFIGLEVAAALRARAIDVHVAAPEGTPLERVLGPEVGARIRALHEEQGVTFHLGTVATAITREAVTLKNGETVPADLVVVGIGVRPRLALAEQAGLALDRGVLVNEFLETSVPGIYAAGDIARWPDPRASQPIRVEHWVVAQRQGQTAARNMLGQRQPFDQVPFFWSMHYDTAIRYVGHADAWDRGAIDGDLAANDCRVAYLQDGRELAVATIGRDVAALQAEVGMEGLRR
jgi:NADPH-dependent 2,4-dienoyl-CoA reductase/sulfur reductase-like enzyme/nitrite reductase/ring-hydroxylating ferredoxin subunit